MKKIFILITAILLTSTMFAQVNVTADITSNTTWSAANVYTLDGLIFVNDGVTLTIEEGTVIKGKLQANITTGDGASALIVRRGGKILAEGTQANPIIFTSELDDVTNPNDLTKNDRGLWGGLLLLGKAITNQPTTENQIEGIPVTEDAKFGGTDDNDNSGILRYVSIRHGGFSISGIVGDEINGLTLGAIGDQTIIEHIEVIANFDDGYEFFGGTVNTKYLVSAFCGDDGFDWDMGFRGKGQFWFLIQGTDEAGRGAEMDGGDDNETGTPYATPYVVNATYIGAGETTSPLPAGDGNDRALYFRDNSGGYYYSSIITDFSQTGVNIEDLASGEDSRARLDAGQLMLANNYWWGFGNGNTLDDIAAQDFVRTHLTANNNFVQDPQLNNISRDTNLDPRPSPSSPAATGAVQPADPFFTVVPYHGAFDPNSFLWTEGWTALSVYGITDVKESYTNNIPASFELSQNYPNPFNPTTKIVYTVSEATNISLTVFNILGQQVAQLVNDFKNVGTYEVTFDAENLPSGLYLYTFDAGNTRITKKMTLLK
ncbi:MAG: T9SS type A sorting domain-containing protein [Ignavibacterium sp.]|nr:T9SS type A sorting domain-containing protein [Ignavibacterium sp.]